MTIAQSLYTHHRKKVWFILVGLLGISGLNRLLKEFGRLLWEPGFAGAIDLKIFYEAVQLWFSGSPVYGELPSAVYPPASYLMLWPFLGWLPVSSARLLWAVATVLALVWLVYLVIRESEADSWVEQALLGLLPVFYATRTGIGNGQLTVFVIPLLIAGILLLRQQPRRFPQTLLAVAMVIGALIKPNVSAPFFWLVLFATIGQKYLPALLVILGYGGLTLIASGFQSDGAIVLMQQWFSQAEVGAEYGAQMGGYANQNSLLSWLEMNTNLNQYPLLTYIGDFELNTPLTLLFLLGLGVWVYWHRNLDIWLLLGVCAIVARLWTYHRIYDDMLILLPTIATFRIYRQLTTQPSEGQDSTSLNAAIAGHERHSETNWKAKVAGGLFAIAYLAAVMPANWLEAGGLVSAGFKVLQVVTWLGLLTFLGYWAWRWPRIPA